MAVATDTWTDVIRQQLGFSRREDLINLFYCTYTDLTNPFYLAHYLFPASILPWSLINLNSGNFYKEATNSENNGAWWSLKVLETEKEVRHGR